MELLNEINVWFEGFAGSDWAIVALAVGTFLESLISFRRAGADAILTYFALQVARLIK